MQICIECQTLFSEKNKKNINLLSAEFAQRGVKVNDVTVHVHVMVFNT